MDQHVKQRKETVSFRVDGTVRTNERHRHGQGRTWTPAKTKNARREIVEAFYEVSGRGWEPWEGPVELYVSCRHQTPKSGWDGQQCNKKPDLDNVLKLVGDALNGVAYRDDAQICVCSARKRYASVPGLIVRLDFLKPPERPLNGWVTHLTMDGTRQLFKHGKPLGTCWGSSGKYMVSSMTPEQMLLPVSKRRTVDPRGPFRTLAMAEKAIREVTK